jgi:beta-phosphoglucomutase-like phosphatase (HAD superfamily)
VIGERSREERREHVQRVAMSIDNADTTPTHDAVEVLMQLNEHGIGLCPPSSDPRAWAGAVLHDLARLAELLGGAVDKVSGKRNDTVTADAQALATVIAAHRNLAVGADVDQSAR